MPFQDTNKEDSQKKGEGDSMIWQTYAVKKLVILEGVIQEIMQRKGQAPNQLLEMAKAILKTLSDIDSLKNHNQDFERLLGNALALVVIIWQSYNEVKAKYHSLVWPPPKLRNILDQLVDTVCCMQKFIGRKCEKNAAKRILVGCFGIRDLGKFHRYQRKLNAVALHLESTPHNINIHAVLLAVVNSRAQPQGMDTELSEELVEGDSPVKKSVKAAAEGSRLRQVGKSTAAKPANKRVESEDVQDNSRHEYVEEHLAEDQLPARKWTDKRTNFNEEARDKQDRRKMIRYEEPNRADLEGTSVQGTRTKIAAQSKTKEKISQGYEDEENDRDTTPKWKGRSRTTPVSSPQTPAPPRHQTTISDFSFNNGAGIMINENIGNIYNSTISDVDDALYKRGKSTALK